jgi:serine/threonine protein phosphatase PrpC
LDGHGGPEVAHFVAQALPKEILLEPYFKLKNYPKALVNVFRRIDELLESERGEEELAAIAKRMNGGGSTGERVGYRAGTTAIVLLVTKHRFYVANIGDSRAVLSRSDAAVPLSTDHKPDLPSERNRIEKAGGYVKEGRVNGSLGLSRSFGDF